MEKMPIYIPVVFVLITLCVAYLFYRASSNSRTVLKIIGAWMALQLLLGISGFYQVSNGVLPRIIVLILPPMLLIILLFLTKAGREFIDLLDQRRLLLIHMLRVPIEIVLFLLYLNKAVPKLMTFEGRNPDILSGISAMVVYYFAFAKGRIDKKMMLVWNLVCLSFLINVLVNGIFSAPTSLQQFAFDQPNKAIIHFPFVWLPSFIVPLVMLSHLAAIRQLLHERSKNKITMQNLTSAL